MRPIDEKLKLIDKRLTSLEGGVKELRGELQSVSRDIQNMHLCMASIEGIMRGLFRREFEKQLSNPLVVAIPSKVYSAHPGTKVASSLALSTSDAPYYFKGDLPDKSIKSNRDSVMGSYSFANYVVIKEDMPLKAVGSKMDMDPLNEMTHNNEDGRAMEVSKMQADSRVLKCGSYNACNFTQKRMGEQGDAIDVLDDMPERRLHGKSELPNEVGKRVRRRLISNSEGKFSSNAEDDVYAMATSLGPSTSLSDTIVSVGNYNLRRNDMLSMRPRCTVLSPVIDCYGALLVANQMLDFGNVSRFYLPSTISARCWKKNMGFDASIVGCPFLRERIGYNIVECSLIYVPVCDDVHWWLVVLDMSLKHVFVIDSLIGPNTGEIPRRSTNEQLLEGLNELFCFVSGKSMDLPLWQVTYIRDAPQQENEVDCGVFVLKNMESWEHLYKCLYTQNDIENIRKKIVCDLMLSKHNEARLSETNGGLDSINLEVEQSTEFLRPPPTVLPELIPYVGMEFETENEAFTFYNIYASTMGFSIRKSTKHANKEGETIDRVYCCSKQGKRDEDRRDVYVRKPRPITRCGCLAQMKISTRDTGTYRVVRFVTEHVHEMETPKNHLLRSQREATSHQASSNAQSGTKGHYG